jgi:hypothetical protein
MKLLKSLNTKARSHEGLHEAVQVVSTGCRQGKP